MSIDIANETDYGTEQGVDAEELVGVARYVLGEMGIHPMAELSILLVDTAAMEQLHIQWMDEPGPTDVLSFPMDELRPARAEDDNEPVPGPARGRRAVPGGGREAGQGRRPLAPPRSCGCSPRTASCTCSATTTPSPRRRPRCSASKNSCSEDGRPGQALDERS